MSERANDFIKWCGGATLIILFLVLFVSFTQEKCRSRCRQRQKAQHDQQVVSKPLGADLDPEKAEQYIRDGLLVKKFEGDDDPSEVIVQSTSSLTAPKTFDEDSEGGSSEDVEGGSGVESSADASESSDKSTALPPKRAPPPKLLHRILGQSMKHLDASGQKVASSKVRPAVKRPDCKLCNTTFKTGDNVCESSNPRCSHMFHQTCVTDWLRFQNTCPSCSETFVVLTM